MKLAIQQCSVSFSISVECGVRLLFYWHSASVMLHVQRLQWKRNGRRGFTTHITKGHISVARRPDDCLVPEASLVLPRRCWTHAGLCGEAPSGGGPASRPPGAGGPRLLSEWPEVQHAAHPVASLGRGRKAAGCCGAGQARLE